MLEQDDHVVAVTVAWLERVVIGLELCPFAKGVHAKGQVRYRVSHAETPDALRADLLIELRALAALDPERVDTSLLIHPRVLRDFLEYNDFLTVAEAAVKELGFEGTLQIASFHPDYRFAGRAPDDVANYVNRSPYPTLHLLREASVDRAVSAFPDAARIYEKNIETLRALGLAACQRLIGSRDVPE